MPEAVKYLIDAAAACALFFALVLVFVVDWAFFSAASAPAANTLKGVVVIQSKTKGAGQKLRLAVTPTARFKKPGMPDEKWDDMGKLLDELGDGYKYDEITEQDILQKKKKLSDYDVVFLTCAQGGEELNNQLRDFVGNGGILYASDWRYDAVKAAFPDMASEKLVNDGERQEVEAQVVDPALREAITASSVKIKFDLPEWKAAAFAGPRVKVLMQGRYRIYKSTEYASAPLMVKFTPLDKGTVIFTSFHNEKQNSRVEKQLLQYLVFSLVTAGVDADMSSSLDKEGFTAQRSNLLSTPKNEAISKEYNNKRASTLRFVLGFNNEGNKLRFSIKSPSGLQFTHDCQSTVILEVPNAEPGTWTYTATALDTYANFPFIMRVAAK